MKKCFKIIPFIAVCFSLAGCSISDAYNRSAENKIAEVCTSCKEVNTTADLIDNVTLQMNTVNAVKGNFSLTNTKDTYSADFEIITKQNRLEWDMYATTTLNDKNITAYSKNGKLYLTYPRNGANLVVKDTYENFYAEALDTLDKLKATYNEDDIQKLFDGTKLDGLKLEAAKENGIFTKQSDGTYKVTFTADDLQREYIITSNFLIKEFRTVADNFNYTFTLSYPKSITINYPMGLDFLTSNVQAVKKVLDIDSFAELVDESLKTEKSN